MKSFFWNVPDKASCNIIKTYGEDTSNSISIKDFQLIQEGKQKKPSTSLLSIKSNGAEGWTVFSLFQKQSSGHPISQPSWCSEWLGQIIAKSLLCIAQTRYTTCLDLVSEEIRNRAWVVHHGHFGIWGNYLFILNYRNSHSTSVFKSTNGSL